MGRPRKHNYVVKLTKTQRNKLKQALRGGKAPVLELRRMQVLLMTDANGPDLPDATIATAASCSVQTVINIRQRFVERGFQGAIPRKRQEQPSRTPLLDGHSEARIIALACSDAPEGSARWSLRLLAKGAVELEIVDHLSHETVRRLLKKRTQAASEAAVVHSSKRKRGVCRSHGGRSGPLLPTGKPTGSDHQHG